MKAVLIVAALCLFALGCSQKSDAMKPYVIEVTTFKYKNTVDADAFWARDAEIQDDYTSKQPGFISRESGYSPNLNEVVVVVKWETQADADASMNKFMGDESVSDFAEMINGPTMKMARYDVK